MYCGINGWVREKHPLQQLHLKRGGGRTFEGGLIFGDYGTVCICVTKYTGVTVSFPVPLSVTNALCKLCIHCFHGYAVLVCECVLCDEYTLPVKFRTISSLTYVWEHYANDTF